MRRALIAILLSFCAATLMAAPLSGTKSIGPTGDYSSITAALADIQAQTLGGPLVLELQPAYLCSVETFPLAFTNLGTTATNTLTLRPKTGAVGLLITSALTTAATVDLNGTQYVTLDGRAGGTGGPGTAKQLTITNTSATAGGRALRFVNEASHNTLTYLTLRSSNPSFSGGTVFFGTTTGENGNDNNTIESCDLGDGAALPAIAIYSSGTNTTLDRHNSGNTISRCNIFNFHNTTVLTAGIYLASASSDWTFSGNSFYQTSTRASGVVSVYAFLIASGSNHNVTGNYIGGDSPRANVALQKWTTSGTAAGFRFIGIQLNVGVSGKSLVQSNTIMNMDWSSGSQLSPVWTGINIINGTVDVGGVSSNDGNELGTFYDTNSISVKNAASATVVGISSSSPDTVRILNNTLGSLTTSGTTTSTSVSLIGIQVTAGQTAVEGNVIGSNVANSLNASTASTDANGQHVTGILCTGGTNTSINYNLVFNLNNNYVGTSTVGQVRGIATSAGMNTIEGNEVRLLSTASRNPGTGAASSLLGIVNSSFAAGQKVTKNEVYSLTSNAASAGISVTGICHVGNAVAGTNVVECNYVHTLNLSSTSTASSVTGMYFAGGTFVAQNNMVTVGYYESGSSASMTRGIYDTGSEVGRKFYHNSVYVEGSQTSGSASSFAFASTGAGAGGTLDVRNNIFQNGRRNVGGSGIHYAVSYAGTAAGPEGLIASHNVFHVAAPAGVLGRYHGTDHASIPAWQTATGVDRESALVEPRFKFVSLDPPYTARNLHMDERNSVEGRGVDVGVLYDFDGHSRSSQSPIDIGADAGNFTYSLPLVSYVPLGNTSLLLSRPLAGFAAVSAFYSMSGGSAAPRLYYKKATDADVLGGNSAGDNGWKYVTASNASSPYDFTIDYSLLRGSGVMAGDVIQYFVFVQDGVGNGATYPSGGVCSGETGSKVVTIRPATVSSYAILSVDLTALTLSSGELSPAFSPVQTSYTVAVPFATTLLTLAPAAADPAAGLAINGNVPALPVTLNVGTTAIAVVVTAQDGSITKTYTVQVTRSPGTAFQQWAASNGVLFDPQATGANGMSNLLNFAFGLNPALPGGQALRFEGNVIVPGGMTTELVAGNPVIKFIRRADPMAAGLVYTVQFSADLGSWEADERALAVLASDGVYQVVSLGYPLLAGGVQAKFCRVKVSLVP